MNNQHHVRPHKSLQRTALSLFVSKLLLGTVVSSAVGVVIGAPALAQDAAAEPSMEVISVKGTYSKSLEKAVDLKKQNIGFSDSIVATDIADFPEQNLAEALQRMPGVTIERNKGLGSKVNVRSLPSDFTHVSINNLATASGSGGRDVEFDIFASEIIQSVTVTKSPTAADEEGGIAGSVQIATAKPFDFSERQLVASAEGAYNSISEQTDPKFSLLASDTFGDWGALVSFSKAERTNRTDSNSGINFRPMGRFLEASGTRSTQAAAVLARDAGINIKNRLDKQETSRIIFQDKVGDRLYLNEQDKWGATASLQYKPDASFSLSFDAMLGSYDSNEDEYDAAAYSASSRSTLETIHAFDATSLAPYGIVVLTDVSYTATQHEILSKERLNATEFDQYSANMDWKIQDWTIAALIGYSGADKTVDYANLKHVAYAPSRTRYTATGGETVKSANAASIDMYNAPEKYLFEAYETELEQVSDDKYAAQLDFRRELQLSWLPALSQVDFGVRYTDKSKERNFGAIKIQGPAAGNSSWVNVRTMKDSQLQFVTDVVSGGGYQPKDLNWQQISNDYARSTFRYDGFYTPFQDDQYYRVDEEVTALYAMSHFDFELGGFASKLNAGIRAVDTSVLSFGYHPIQKPDGSTGYTDDPVSKEGSYTDVLPSMNLTVEIFDDVIWRTAASETLMRPALSDIAYKRTVSWSGFRFKDGNPDLKPTQAKQWETGVEWYLENGGILAASYFWKEIEGVVREALTGVVKDVEKRNANGTLDGYYDFDVFQPVNADGSYKVSGLELIAQLPLETFSDSLTGFGINANYTMLDNTLTGASDLKIPTPPEGLADSTYNMTVYYENDRFDTRLSYNYKDKYVEYIHLNMYPVYRDSYGQFDLAIGYQLLDNVKLSLKGINITDEETKGYTLLPAFPVMQEFSGRRISLGIRADF